MQKTKIYEVIWTEMHSVYVRAKNEIEAKDKACSGNVLTDESVEMDETPIAREVSKKEMKNLGLK